MVHTLGLLSDGRTSPESESESELEPIPLARCDVFWVELSCDEEDPMGKTGLPLTERKKGGEIYLK